MTMQEYRKQVDPRRLPMFSVEVKESDCMGIWKQRYLIAGKWVNIRIINLLFDYGCFSYYCTEDGNCYVVDEDGNKKVPSVFKLSSTLN